MIETKSARKGSRRFWLNRPVLSWLGTVANGSYRTGFSDPGGIRTHDLQIRNLLLYPAELRSQFNHISLSVSVKKNCSPLSLSALTLPSVGAAGFEPTASCSQSRRDTRLRYAPRIYPLTHNTTYLFYKGCKGK